MLPCETNWSRKGFDSEILGIVSPPIYLVKMVSWCEIMDEVEGTMAWNQTDRGRNPASAGCLHTLLHLYKSPFLRREIYPTHRNVRGKHSDSSY